MRGMGGLSVVVRQPLTDPGAHFRSCLKGIQIDAFVLQRAPLALDHPIVTPGAFPVHAYLDLCICQHVETACNAGAIQTRL